MKLQRLSFILTTLTARMGFFLVKVTEATEPLMDGREKGTLQGQSLCNTHPHVLIFH
jgi:hypothetical protein